MLEKLVPSNPCQNRLRIKVRDGTDIRHNQSQFPIEDYSNGFSSHPGAQQLVSAPKGAVQWAAFVLSSNECFMDVFWLAGCV